MRHGSQNRRPRNRSHNGGQGGHNRNGQNRPAHNRNQIFDSNGPDVRIRGTAHQVCEKYLTLAKDATSMGDVVLAESYLQHAEHYQRIINSWNEEFQSQQRSFTPQEQAEQQPTDDLSLPVSILGGDVKANGQQPVRAETREQQDVLEAV